jgi:hypothetical protein
MGLYVGGSRERPKVWQVCRSFVIQTTLAQKGVAMLGKNITLGKSREPPVFTFSGRTRDQAKVTRR